MGPTSATNGRVISVRGAVLDVVFDGTALPPIDAALVVSPDYGAPIIAEVQSHLDETTVRAIALQSTPGLRRGAAVRATGAPLEVPVGEALLGRLLDLTGSIGDKGKPLPADVPRRPIHRSPPPIVAQGSAGKAVALQLVRIAVAVAVLILLARLLGFAALLCGALGFLVARPLLLWRSGALR